VGEVGELVITEPMPSMPIYFWNDPDGDRYRSSYFDVFPGVWRHGDWIKLTDRGSAVIYGRSDSTINRGGVRMGTSEIYSAVEALPEVVDSLVVDVDDEMILFVVVGGELTDELSAQIRRSVREHCSPRHIPDRIVQIPEVPRTLSNKKLEVPVKKILLGAAPESAASRDSLANPAALDWIADFRVRAS
jgi:acetoacetyl-CoA synthetase